MTFRKSEHDPEGWYVLVTATATKPGTWTSTGIDVEWTSGWWRRGTTHYDYRVSLIASP
jgi:hypothetical protein